MPFFCYFFAAAQKSKYSTSPGKGELITTMAGKYYFTIGCWCENQQRRENRMKDIIIEYQKKGYFVATINAVHCKKMSSFLRELGIAFNFPDYYGMNINALNECLNDLDWIQEENYVLVIQNSKYLLLDEPLEDQESINNFLEGVKNEWASVPNYPGEENFRDKADFIIIKE